MPRIFRGLRYNGRYMASARGTSRSSGRDAAASLSPLGKPLLRAWSSEYGRSRSLMPKGANPRSGTSTAGCSRPSSSRVASRMQSRQRLHHATIDKDALPGDVPGLFGGQEGGETTDIARRTIVAHRDGTLGVRAHDVGTHAFAQRPTLIQIPNPLRV